MKIEVAGFNIDASISKQLDDRNNVTPETLSAAYARISRSPKRITQLRKDAIAEVDRARKSNQSIIFEMGHSSVAEHAVFNFDLIGVSRYLAEWIQRTRLASFTEKSQRYVTLEGDYVTPDEIKGTELEAQFHELIRKQNQLYFDLFETQREQLQLAGFEGKKRELDGAAKEDARYVLSLATESQMGMTINCRSLQRMLRRLDRVNLAEARQLKEKLEAAAREIAPSLIRYTDSDDFEKTLPERIPSIVSQAPGETLVLVDASDHIDERVLAGVMFEELGGDYRVMLEAVVSWSDAEKAVAFENLFRGLKPYSVMPRGFEAADFMFQVKASSSCYAQWKRHRTSTILFSGRLDSFVIPPSYGDGTLITQFKNVMGESADFARKLRDVNRLLGDYALTNAHEVSFLFKANLRELYHFSRLRSDNHAQWEIREFSRRIGAMVREKAPLSASRMMGKSEMS